MAVKASLTPWVEGASRTSALEGFSQWAILGNRYESYDRNGEERHCRIRPE